MKTIEKKSEAISSALVEVWEWKENAANEIKNKSFEKKKIIYDNALEEASKILKSAIVKESSGTYKFIES
jgi:hypothetical protein